MLNRIFFQVLDMSYTAGFVILLILLARVALRKAPKIFSYALWSAALFRLICPWSFESALSLLAVGGGAAERLRPFSPQNLALSSVPGSTVMAPPAVPIAPAASLPGNVFALLWLIGIAVLLIYNTAALFRLKKQLKGALRDTQNIYLSQRVSTPFVIGIIRPKIYLPQSLSGSEKEYILLHERTHIRRLDHVIKLASFIVLCIHWFNPLVWLAFLLSGKDMEMSCDEAVIHKLGGNMKKDYSSTLLALSTGRRIVGGTPLAFGEGDAKGRIHNVLHYQRPAFWAAAIGLAAVIALCFGLAANPKSPKSASDPDEQKSGASGSAAPAQQGGLSFWVKPDEPAQVIGENAAIIWLKSYMGESAPPAERIADYEIHDVTVIAGAPKEGQPRQDIPYHYVVRVSYGITTASDAYFAPGDGVSGKGTFKGLFRELCVRDLESGNFDIVEAGTGGGEQAFMSAADPLEAAVSIAGLIETICASPAQMSNPQAYIDAHPVEYRALLSCGDDTLDYCFALFAQGGQTGLEGHIMASACRDILAAKGAALDDILYNTGQDWYDGVKNDIRHQS